MVIGAHPTARDHPSPNDERSPSIYRPPNIYRYCRGRCDSHDRCCRWGDHERQSRRCRVLPALVHLASARPFPCHHCCSAHHDHEPGFDGPLLRYPHPPTITTTHYHNIHHQLPYFYSLPFALFVHLLYLYSPPINSPLSTISIIMDRRRVEVVGVRRLDPSAECHC